jgi:density-regulated protein
MFKLTLKTILQFCSYYPEFEKCKKWLEKNLPTEFAKLEVKGSGQTSEAGCAVGEEDEKKRQKRGGKGMIKANKKKDEDGKDRKISVSRAPRGKKKSVTVVTGMSSFGKNCDILIISKVIQVDLLGIDLKLASKFFGSKFACGSSVTGEDEIVIQGDVKDDLFDVIPEKWPEIEEDAIDDMGDLKR